jgi:predicted phage terminase large subunit-like protein
MGINRQEAIDKLLAREELYVRRARNGDFKSFLLFLDYDFFTKRASIIDKIVDVFQKVHDAYAEGKSLTIGISMPPRSGKSYTTSCFCAFMLGRFPKESIMRNTCTATLYKELSKSTLDIVASDKWFRIFKIPLETKGVETWRLETARQSSYYGGGVDGTIIGKGASLLAISDDLYKGLADAISIVSNQTVFTWHASAMRTRLEGNCCRVYIGTRWTNNDLMGKIDEMGLYDYYIKIPALDEKNESFCPAVLSTQQLLDLKREIGDEVFEAEYQQNPIDIKGRLFSKDDFEYFTLDDIKGMDTDANIGVCDSADEGTDFLSAPMVKKIGNKYYLYDVIFTQERVEVTEHLLTGSLKVNKVDMMRFESNNGGKIFAENIAENVETEITWKTTTTNKETRILVDSAWIKNHIVFRKDILEGSEYSKFMDQLLSYIKGIGNKNQHDDAVDSLSMLKRFIYDLGLSEEIVDSSSEWKSYPVTALYL